MNFTPNIFSSEDPLILVKLSKAGGNTSVALAVLSQ